MKVKATYFPIQWPPKPAYGFMDPVLLTECMQVEAQRGDRLSTTVLYNAILELSLLCGCNGNSIFHPRSMVQLRVCGTKRYVRCSAPILVSHQFANRALIAPLSKSNLEADAALRPGQVVRRRHRPISTGF